MEHHSIECRAMKVERGFTYVMMIFAVAIAGLLLAAAGQAWSEKQRRVKEAELIRIGAEVVRAIASYYESSPGTVPVLPAKLDDLLLDNRFAGTRRHLRRIYVDPITRSSEWGLIRSPLGGISGVYSLSDESPLARAPIDLGGFVIKPGSRYSDMKFEYVPSVRAGKKET